MRVRGSSRFNVDGVIHKIRKGLAVYKVRASPYYRVRIWIPSESRYVVKSTKMTSRIEAIEAGEEYLVQLSQKRYLGNVPKSRLFSTYADLFIENQKRLAKDGEIHPLQVNNDKSNLFGDDGIAKHFDKRDIKSIRTSDLTEYLHKIRGKRDEKLSPSTVNKKLIVFRKVMRLAYEAGVIDNVPETPTVNRNDNPRPFFKFHPLVPESKDEYQKILAKADELAREDHKVRGIPITIELYDFIIFLAHSFLRPVESEIFALQHKHITVASDPKRCILTVADGKTGYRTTNTLEACVSVYERICARNPDHEDDDYIFFPAYKNRQTVIKIVTRQFNYLLDKLKLKIDPITGQAHTVYSLRHTAICMRLIKSEGQVNIFNLAKTAGTSVDQIERFYARNLPLSAEMARNLQSFGREK